MAWRDVLSVHPACALFPRMKGDELRLLGEDIKKNRLQDWIKLIRDGDRYVVIDGQNRLDAHEAVGLPIQIYDGNAPNRNFFEVVDLERLGISAIAYIIAMNIRRRHLSGKDRARLMAELIKAEPTKSNRQIAKQVGASPTTASKVRGKLEAKGDVSKMDTRTDSKGRWQRVRKSKPAAPGKGRKRRPPAAEPTRDETEPGLPLGPQQVPKSLDPISSGPEVEPAPSNPAVVSAPSPDPIRLHVASVIGSVAALNRIPDDIDFNRMAHIVEASERPHLRSRVSRGTDVLQSLWLALRDASEPPALAEEEPSPDIIDDLPSLEIVAKIPPIP